jgi:hypothetical protein
MVIAVLVRRLRNGKTYDDFRAAWEADRGFGIPTRVVTGQRLDDDREIITIGFVDVAPEALATGVERVAEQERVRHDRIDAVVEPEMTRAFYAQVADDDLT